MRKVVFAAVLLMFVGLPAAHAQNADAIMGQWLSETGESHIEIYKCADKYCGKIVWLKEPNNPDDGKPKCDKNNPDESKRDRPALGLNIMWDFAYDGKEWWDGGKVYDPKNGKTYKGKMRLDNGDLKLRGYAGPFYRTATWKKV